MTGQKRVTTLVEATSLFKTEVVTEFMKGLHEVVDQAKDELKHGRHSAADRRSMELVLQVAENFVNHCEAFDGRGCGRCEVNEGLLEAASQPCESCGEEKVS